MRQYGEISPMFVLTDSQIRIISRMLSIEKSSNNEQIGVTKYEMDFNKSSNSGKKTDERISRRTFGDNEKQLAESYCIRILREEQRKSQKVKFYQVTPIGFFHLIKSVNITQIDKKYNYHFKRFLPYISQYWSESLLLDVFDRKLLLMILQYTMSLIDLEQSQSIWMHNGEKSTNQYRCVINFPIRQDIAEIQIKSNFLVGDHGIPYNKNTLKKYKEKQIPLEYAKDVSFFIKNLSGLFYLNLLRLNYDVLFRDKIYTVFKNKPHPDGSSLKEMAQYQRELSEFSKLVKSKTKKIYDILKKDKEVSKEIINLLDEFKKYVKESKHDKEIRSSLVNISQEKHS